MAHYQTKHHGYNDDELISTLQKEVRRGNEEKAIYWALELGEEGKSGFGQLAARHRAINGTSYMSQSGVFRPIMTQTLLICLGEK